MCKMRKSQIAILTNGRNVRKSLFVQTTLILFNPRFQRIK
jgi:hypothetical protein